VAAAYDSRERPLPCYGAGAMAHTPFDDLVHRVNNLLGTIAVQAELAQAEGSLAAHHEALQRIVESAARTQAELRRIVAAPREPGIGEP